MRKSWIIHALLMLRISSCVMRAWCSKGDGKGEAVKDKVTASNNSFWLWGGRGGHTQEMSRRFPTPFFFQKGNPSISRLLHWAIVFDNVFYECAWMGCTKRENSNALFSSDFYKYKQKIEWNILIFKSMVFLYLKKLFYDLLRLLPIAQSCVSVQVTWWLT